MWISRLRVTGGFLADLDVEFGRGLNVIVGPRGAGKTTLLELVRHALGVEHADRMRADRQKAFVKELLGTGEVVLDLESETEAKRIVVDAQGGGRPPELAPFALMLGQNELEDIASDAGSRLRLIDLRAQSDSSIVTPPGIARLTIELARLRASRTQLCDQLDQRPLLVRDLEELQARESELLADGSEQLSKQRDQLATVESAFVALQSESTRLDAALQSARQVLELAQSLGSPLSALAGLDLADLVPDMDTGLLHARTLFDDFDTAMRGTESLLVASLESRVSREQELRVAAEPIRAALDAAERGLGEITARVRNLQMQLAQLDLKAKELRDLESQYESKRAERNALLVTLEERREELFERRMQVARSVSNQLGGRIVIAIEHLADTSEFVSFLTANLTNTGLQYRTLADALTRSVFPQQLLNFVENDDIEGLARVSGVNEGRVGRVVDRLQNGEVLAKLASVSLLDRADFLLMDNSLRKSVDSLSTGQKCAVTLPVLLTEYDRALILDQPEDHLDNAYLVDNIVEAFNSRSRVLAQTIVATHNANIPVLGSACNVVSLQSNGARGFVKDIGTFDAPGIVGVITSLMEGGAEAFERRAKFYSEHRLEP